MAVKRHTIRMPMNRVEGDLELKVSIEDGRVTEAWSCGTLYRGFERMLQGRGSLDGIAITPRICGICSTAHVAAASSALEDLLGITPPPRATLLRNAALLAENIQSDVRHTVLMFAPDLPDQEYRDPALSAMVRERFQPLAGSAAIQTLNETRRLPQIISTIAGVWPHAPFMMPGGVVSTPDEAELIRCRGHLVRFRKWYERDFLGGGLEEVARISTSHDLWNWIDSDRQGSSGHLAVLLRALRDLGADRHGAWPATYLSVGGFPVPDGSSVPSGPGGLLIPAGVVDADGRRTSFNRDTVTEDLTSSWYTCEPTTVSPSDHSVAPRPFATGEESGSYSWAKAPRYSGAVAETGPLAEAMVAGDPLIVDLVGQHGPTVLVRQLARALRPVRLLPALDQWLVESLDGGTRYEAPDDPVEGEGVGVVEAARGALGHWVRLDDGKITHYQVIAPTTWNASPRDGNGQPGAIEQAVLNTRVENPENPALLGLVVRSFDPCLVCTVHTMQRGAVTGSLRLGGGP